MGGADDVGLQFGKLSFGIAGLPVDKGFDPTLVIDSRGLTLTVGLA